MVTYKPLIPYSLLPLILRIYLPYFLKIKIFIEHDNILINKVNSIWKWYRHHNLSTNNIMKVTKSKYHKLSFHFYIFSYIMTICLCDVVMLLGFVYKITLLVFTNNIHLHMLIHLHLTSYLSVLYFIYGFTCKKV